MVKFAVCDDDYKMTKYISDKLYEFYPNMCVIKTYTNGISLLEDIRYESFDAFFLDIGMPLIDGFDIAKQIRKNDPHVKIIFVTNKAELAHLGYIYNAFRFVRKNRLEKELFETAKSLCESLSSSGEYMNFKNYSGEVLININNVIYFKADDHTLIISGPHEERVLGTMQELEENLKEKGFVRIHKSYLVNIRFIYSIESSSIRLFNDEELPMSRNRIHDIKKMVREYCI